jgi:hypothetical protein
LQKQAIIGLIQYFSGMTPGEHITLLGKQKELYQVTLGKAIGTYD